MSRVDDERDRGRRGETEDHARILALPDSEAQKRLERGGCEIDLALGQRFGGPDLGARRAERHAEPLASEVSVGGRDPDRQILR